MAEIPEQTPAQSAVSTWLNKRRDALARGRWAEEREWYQAGLFDQMKQWLEEDGKKLKPITVDRKRKWPMPVSNHFSKTIATNANALGAAIPEMIAQSDNYDGANRAAAQAAENAIDAANEESGMNILNPILSKQTVLWGLGVTKEEVAFDHSTDEVPDVQQGPDGVQVEGTERVPSPRLKTTLPQVFEVYVPRDCGDANISPLVIQCPRLDLGRAREMYPTFAPVFSKDDSKTNDGLAAFFQASLRSLAYGASKTDDEEKVTLVEGWLEWSQLDEDTQEAIEKEWENEPSVIYRESGMTKLDAAIEFGLFAVVWDKYVVEWGENPWDGDKPFTFFPWQKDVSSPYPMGLSSQLIPLQKQLNRLDSLMERALMSNAVVKLLWPTTQNIEAPTGDPVELTKWDPVGDGKVKPEYFGGKAYGTELVAKRAQVLADFAALGFTNEVAQGEMPGGGTGSGTAFRALAYLGSKAEETRKTQRYLWEQAHELRARKLIKMARKVWSEPRKVQTAGFNNMFGAKQIAAADLQGDYALKVIQDSSRPKTMTEKLEVFQFLVQGGMIDPTDPSIRVYLTDVLGVQDLDLTDNLQYAKAERDLETAKQGTSPQPSPFTNWAIHLKVFCDYCLTEEFEALAPNIQQGILAYAQWLKESAMPPPMPGAPAPPPPSGAPAKPPHPMQKGGVGGQPPGHVLHQVPGQTVSPTQVQGAAEMEGMQVIPNEVGAN